jgi:hypothetical protein
MSDGYNGWSNRETWMANLWIANDGYAGGADEVDERARRLIDDGESKEDATYTLSKEIEYAVDEDMEQTCKVSGLFEDLLGAAVSRINWYEIAEHYVDDAIGIRESNNAEANPVASGETV